MGIACCSVAIEDVVADPDGLSVTAVWTFDCGGQLYRCRPLYLYIVLTRTVTLDIQVYERLIGLS